MNLTIMRWSHAHIYDPFEAKQVLLSSKEDLFCFLE